MVPPEQELASSWQVDEQLKVPALKPSEAQVLPFRLVPSQLSPGSMRPFPQVARDADPPDPFAADPPDPLTADPPDPLTADPPDPLTADAMKTP
jgi:hypothetical protein